MLIKCRDIQTAEKYWVDTETDNESFLKVAMILKSKGVTNCFFHLKIYNKKVAGLDPFSSKLSEEEVLMVYREAQTNKFYFIRECFRLPGAGADPSQPGSGIRFKLHRGNLAYFWARQFNLSVYMVLPRQTGKTWSVLADWTHEFFAYKNASMLHFNKSQTDANENVGRIKSALELLPSYMQHSNVDKLRGEDKRRVKNNEKELRSRYNTRILAMASATNKSKADTLARGKTVEKIWHDEFAFEFFNDIVYDSSMPAYNTAAKNAKIAGIPFGIILTTEFSAA